MLDVSEQTVARRFRALHAAGALRVMALGDARAGGGQVWHVRMHCRPDAADALATTLAARDDVSWVSLASGGSEITCVVRSSVSDVGRSVLLERLPRTAQVLNFTAMTVLHMHVGGDAEWLAFDDPIDSRQQQLLLSGATTGGADTAGESSAVSATIVAADAPLLAALAKDGRAGVVALARATGWPESRVSARLDQLLASGAVHIEVDLAPQQFGFHATAYIWMTVAPGDLQFIGEALSVHPETSFVAAVTGAANLMAVVTCRDTEALYRYVTTKVGAHASIRQAEVVPILKRVKQAGTLMKDGRLSSPAM